VSKNSSAAVPVTIEDILPKLLKVLASETPVRLVKSGKIDGLFTSPGGVNSQPIAVCISSNPALLERVSLSGKREPKPQFVRLTAAGLEAIAKHLPIMEIERIAASAAHTYRTGFRDACLKASENRLRDIRNRQQQLVAENRLIVDTAQRSIKAQIGALQAELAVLENHGIALAVPVPQAALEPCRDRDYEFIQHAAGLMILEWRNAKQPEVRAVLEGVFASLGIKRVGEVGENTSFDPRVHDTTDDAETNSPVTVVQSGWQIKTHRGPILLLKAIVSPKATACIAE